MKVRIRTIETRKCALFGFIWGLITWFFWLLLVALIQVEIKKSFPGYEKWFNDLVANPENIIVTLVSLTFAWTITAALTAAVWNVIGGIEFDAEYFYPEEEYQED